MILLEHVEQSSRVSDIYNEFIDGYGEPDPPPQAGGNQAVAAWARANANPAVAPSPTMRSPFRSPSARGPATSRRKGRFTAAQTPSYDEEDEDGGMDYDDLVKIRVKVRTIRGVGRRTFVLSLVTGH